MAKKRHKPPQQAPNQPRNAPARSDSEKEGSITSQPTDHKTASQVDPKQSLLSNNNARKAAQFITLAALYSSVSQMTLSPVYGSVPAAAYHRYGSLAAALPAFLALSLFRRSIPMSILKILPSFVHWIPSIQFLMFKFSSTLPVPYGPLITESVTYYPLLFLSVCAAGFYFEKVDLRSHSDFFPKQAPPILGYLLFTAIQKTSKKVLTSFMGSNLLFTRLGLQFVLAGFYNIALSAAPIWPCVPALAFTMLGNVHNPLSRTTDVLNNTLALHNFTLLERRESITGYISVLENTDAHFRVMRCDHSLLGGEWTMSPPKGRAPLVREPIYAVFTMLEAVRLIETETGKPRIPDSDSRALNIGLGIGTAPTALIAHGVNTSIVELDPVVYEFALKYFGLPTNHSWTIGDAVPIIANTVDSGVAFKYDYIIHDVFTGGAEPVELFTLEFLSGLHTLLKADGVIAINYAGDLALPAASYIIRTVRAVFPSCRVFREDEPPFARSTSAAAGVESDFTNMVIFCKKSPTQLKFRKAVKADFLGSGARESFLSPKHELEIAPKNFQLEGDILRTGKTKHLERWHRQSALGHWRVMRTVLPAAVWENW